LRPLIDNFSGVCRRIKSRNLVGEIIEIFQRAKIAAHVHGIVEQGERWRCGDGGRGGKAEKTGGGDFIQRNHVGINMVFVAIMSFSVLDASAFVLSSKWMRRGA